MARNKELTRALGGGIPSALALIALRIVFGVGVVVLGLFMIGLLITEQYQLFALVFGAWVVVSFGLAYWSTR